MKKLKEMVDVLSQIVALKCSTQDGGPGSGVKGHTTAEENDVKRTSANQIEKLQKQYSAANQSHITGRQGISDALAMLGNTSNPNSLAKAKKILEQTLKQMIEARKEH